MMTALWILAWIVALAVAAVVLLLVTPTVFLIDATFGASGRARLWVRPLGGLAPAIGVFDTAKPHPEAGSPRKPRRRKPYAKDTRKRRRPTPGARALAALPDLVRGLIGTVHVEDLAVSVDFGAGDPADTGAIYGAMTPFLYGTWLDASRTVDIRPDFTRARLDGAGTARLRFTPVAVLPPAVRFGWAAFGPSR